MIIQEIIKQTNDMRQSACSIGSHLTCNGLIGLPCHVFCGLWLLSLVSLYVVSGIP